jgi:hypothetical protein
MFQPRAVAVLSLCVDAMPMPMAVVILPVDAVQAPPARVVDQFNGRSRAAFDRGGRGRKGGGLSRQRPQA